MQFIKRSHSLFISPFTRNKNRRFTKPFFLLTRVEEVTEAIEQKDTPLRYI